MCVHACAHVYIHTHMHIIHTYTLVIFRRKKKEGRKFNFSKISCVYELFLCKINTYKGTSDTISVYKVFIFI